MLVETFEKVATKRPGVGGREASVDVHLHKNRI